MRVETRGQKQNTALTPRGWGLTVKISVLQSVVTADKSCAKERMLQAGLEPPRVDWSPPRPLTAGFKME